MSKEVITFAHSGYFEYLKLKKSVDKHMEKEQVQSESK